MQILFSRNRWSSLILLTAIAIGSSSALAAKFDHSHSIANKVLKKYVVVKGPISQVNYEGLKKDAHDLNEYLKSIQMVSKDEFMKFSKEQQLAYLINAYNLYTLKLIIEHYPLKSIKDIGSLFSNTWSKKFDWLKLFGEKVSLDNIEHDMIREKKDDLSNKIVKVKFAEPRIHFAVNCASIGCPMLMNEAFTASNLEANLEKATNLFLSDPVRNRYDAKEKKLYLSHIFDWYGSDFEKYSGGVFKFVATRITQDPAAQKLIAEGKADREWTEYDWNLNKVQ